MNENIMKVNILNQLCYKPCSDADVAGIGLYRGEE